MKTQLGLLCFAVVTSLAKAELGAPRLPAHIEEKIRFPLDNYRPLLDQLNIETVSFNRHCTLIVLIARRQYKRQKCKIGCW